MLGADPIADVGARKGSRKIEDVDQRGPGECLPQRNVISHDDLDPRGRVEIEGVGGEVVHEPDQRDHGLCQISSCLPCQPEAAPRSNVPGETSKTC